VKLLRQDFMKTLLTLLIILGILILPIITLFAGAIFLYVKALAYSVNKTLDNLNGGNIIAFNNINYSTPYASFMNKTNDSFLTQRSYNNWEDFTTLVSFPEAEKIHLDDETETQFKLIIRNSF
jgi:hypothetical protein